MDISFIKKKFGLLIVVLIATFFAGIATKFDENLLKDGISTPSILFIEAGTLVSILIFYYIYSFQTKNKLFSDLKKINYLRLSIFYFITILMVVTAFLVNDAVKQYGSSLVEIEIIIMGLLLYGFVYFILNNNKNQNNLKIVSYLIILISSYFFLFYN